MAENPQPIPSYIDYVKERAGELYEMFGTDVDKYSSYYTENRPYFYCKLNEYGEILDEDAKSIGIANNDKRILDKAISMWEKGKDIEKAKRILYRYTLLRYDNAKQWREWYNKIRANSSLLRAEAGCGWSMISIRRLQAMTTAFSNSMISMKATSLLSKRKQPKKSLLPYHPLSALWAKTRNSSSA